MRLSGSDSSVPCELRMSLEAIESRCSVHRRFYDQSLPSEKSVSPNSTPMMPAAPGQRPTTFLRGRWYAKTKEWWGSARRSV